MAGALSAPGPGRFAAADAVVRARPDRRIGHDEDADRRRRRARASAAGSGRRARRRTSRRRSRGRRRLVPGRCVRPARRSRAARAVRTRCRGHGWPSAALTPYELRAGRRPPAPARRRRRRAPRRCASAPRCGSPRPRARRPTGSPASPAARPGDGGQARAVLRTRPPRSGSSGTPDRVNAIGVFAAPGRLPSRSATRLRARLGGGVEVLDREPCRGRRRGRPQRRRPRERSSPSSGRWAASRAVALFVVAGTFAPRDRPAAAGDGRAARARRHPAPGPAADRRRGADRLARSPARSACWPAGRSRARSPASLVDHGAAAARLRARALVGPARRRARASASASRSSRSSPPRAAPGASVPAEALREVAVEHARPGVVRVAHRAALPWPAASTMALVFTGMRAQSFAILGGDAARPPAVACSGAGCWASRRPCSRGRCGASGAPGLLASTGLAANRWRTAALATPIVLIAMLAGDAGPAPDQRPAQHRARDRRPRHRRPRGHRARRRAAAGAAAANELAAPAGRHGRRGDAADGGLPARPRASTAGTSPVEGRRARRRRAGPHARPGRRRAETCAAVRGTRWPSAAVVASDGHVGVGDVIHARMADTRAAVAASRRGLRPRRRPRRTSCSTRRWPARTPAAGRPVRCSSPAAPHGRSLARPLRGRAPGRHGARPGPSTSTRSTARRQRRGHVGRVADHRPVARCSPRWRSSTRPRWPPPSAVRSWRRSACWAARRVRPCA